MTRATDRERRPEPGDRPSPVFRALRASSVGIEMAVATALGWAFGAWLDRRLGSGPWLMLVFLLLGVAAGFLGLFRAAKAAQRDAQDGAAIPTRLRERATP